MFASLRREYLPLHLFNFGVWLFVLQIGRLLEVRGWVCLERFPIMLWLFILFVYNLFIYLFLFNRTFIDNRICFLTNLFFINMINNDNKTIEHFLKTLLCLAHCIQIFDKFWAQRTYRFCMFSFLMWYMWYPEDISPLHKFSSHSNFAKPGKNLFNPMTFTSPLSEKLIY